MESNAEREDSGLTVAYLEKLRVDMDRLGIVLDADGERGYQALIEAARQSGVDDVPEELGGGA
jgi:hypothetical protein